MTIMVKEQWVLEILGEGEWLIADPEERSVGNCLHRLHPKHTMENLILLNKKTVVKSAGDITWPFDLNNPPDHVEVDYEDYEYQAKFLLAPDEWYGRKPRVTIDSLKYMHCFHVKCTVRKASFEDVVRLSAVCG